MKKRKATSMLITLLISGLFTCNAFADARTGGNWKDQEEQQTTDFSDPDQYETSESNENKARHEATPEKRKKRILTAEQRRKRLVN